MWPRGNPSHTTTRIQFGDVTVDWNYDLFFDSLCLFNGDTVLIDFWGDLWDNRMKLPLLMELVTADGDTITFYVVHFEGGIRFGIHFGGVRRVIAL